MSTSASGRQSRGDRTMLWWRLQARPGKQKSQAIVGFPDKVHQSWGGFLGLILFSPFSTTFIYLIYLVMLYLKFLIFLFLYNLSLPFHFFSLKTYNFWAKFELIYFLTNLKFS